MPDQSSAATEHAILQEITAPLDTLPDDPVAVVQADFPAALRGYDRLAVDAYVQRVSQLVAELQATRSPEAAVRRALERVGEQISGVLQRAHETAEQITVQSRREAEDRLEQARAEARQIAGLAEQRVKDLDADTDRIWIERHRIVDDARDLASQLLTLAATAGERFPEADATEPETGGAEAPPPDEETPPPYEEAPSPYEEAPSPYEAPALDEDEEANPPSADEKDTEPYGEPETPPPASHSAGDLQIEPAADELGETVAFAPLEPEDEEHDDEPPPPPERGSSRSVIPPASQAASRRSSR